MSIMEQYIADHINVQSDLLRDLERATHQRVVQPRMLSGHLQGELLSMLVAISGASTILELGTFTGYSAICLACGMREGGVVHTIEINDELESIASEFIARSGLNIVQHVGDGRVIAPSLGCSFDLVFMDADKREYPQYYDMLFDNNLVHSGSVILADNVLWSGKVVEQPTPKDAHTQALLEFNDTVARDPRVDRVILPLRDGLTIIRVK